jgi:hypothetical protein
MVAVWRADRRIPSMELFQLSGSLAPLARDDHVDMLGAKLS